MTAGQPQNQTATSVFYVYLNSFPYLKLGYGAALSLILAGIILAFTIVQVALTPPEPRMTAGRWTLARALGRARSRRARCLGRSRYSSARSACVCASW